VRMFMLSLGIFFRHFELANAAITGTGSSSSLQTCLSRSLAAEEHTATENRNELLILSSNVLTAPYHLCARNTEIHEKFASRGPVSRHSASE
jgi:hypothetical protein